MRFVRIALPKVLKRIFAILWKNSSVALPSITSKKDKPQNATTKETTGKSQISNLYVGQHIDGRYTIQRDFGERDGWLSTKQSTIDREESAFLKCTTIQEMQITDVPFLLESLSDVILAPAVIQREPILIVALPIRTQVFRPIWKMLAKIGTFIGIGAGN